MEFRVTDTAVSVCDVLADTMSELPVDGDFVLPEYCPDVAAVLKCTLTPLVQSRQMSTDRLLADGVVQVRVLYLDEERRCVRSCEFSQPFSTAFPLPPMPGGAFLRLNAKTDYVNCRAVSPRRLDIHGAFTLKLRAMAAAEQNAILSVEGEGVHTRRVRLQGTVPAAFAEKPFTVSEILEAGEGRHPAEMMLKTSVTPVVTDCKVLMNKAILKGNLLLKALYVTDAAAGTAETAEAEVPFSQILDLEGLNEEWICDADVTLLSEEVRVEASGGGDTALLSVNAKLLAILHGWRSESAEVVCDAYSAHCPLVTEIRQMEMPQLLGVWRDERTVRQTFELPSDTVKDILDMWCEVSGAGMAGDGEHLTLDGRLLWCMLVRDNSGELSYYERAENFSLPYEDGGRDDTPDVRVCRTAFQNGGGKLELRVDLAVTRRCQKTHTHTVLGHVTADEAAAYPPDKAALKICYATKGESLWDIARRCRTSVEAVMEENHLTGDTLSADTMLLIPLC